MRPQPTPGVPYLRTLVGGKGAWWRLIVAALASAVGLLVTSTAALFLVLGVARVFDSDYELDFDNGIDAGEILALNLGLMALIPLAAGLVRLLYGVKPRWLSSHRPRLAWWWLWICVGASAVVWALFWGLGGLAALIAREDPVSTGLFAFLIVVLLTTPLQAAGEEYVFRGLILQALGATRMAAWLACGLSALLFATAHLQFDPPLFLDRFMIGVALAYLAMKTGGLEAPIAIHAVLNISAFIPAGLLGETSEALDPGDTSWLLPVIHGVQLAVIVPWILYLYKKRRPRLEPAGGHQQAAPQPQWQGGYAGWNPPAGAQPPYGPPPGWQQPPPGRQPGPPPGWRPPYPPPPGWQPRPPPPPPGWQPPPPQR